LSSVLKYLKVKISPPFFKEGWPGNANIISCSNYYLRDGVVIIELDINVHVNHPGPKFGSVFKFILLSGHPSLKKGGDS